MASSPTSPFRHPSYSHALINSFAFSQVGWIITRRAVTKAADRKAWIKQRSGPRGGPCVIQRTEQRQYRGEPKMRYGIIPIGFNATMEPVELTASAGASICSLANAIIVSQRNANISRGERQGSHSSSSNAPTERSGEMSRAKKYYSRVLFL